MRYIVLLALAVLFSYTVKAQCLEIESILVDACVPGGGSGSCSEEGVNEMVRFSIGSSPIAVSDISVNWPNNSFIGWCRNAQTASKTDSLNQTITNGCGFLLEPLNDTLPANATVLAITSEDFCVSANSFDGLADTLYIIYQCSGNTAGHFANSGSSALRTLDFFVTGPCTQTESVSYDRSLTIGGDGATVNFDAAGNPTYVNNGCNAPVEGTSAGWNIQGKTICASLDTVLLPSLLTTGSAGGTWSGPNVVDSFYIVPGVQALDSITYTVTFGACVNDSTILFSVDSSPVGNEQLSACDSVFYLGTWYSSDTLLSIPFPSAFPLGCDSIHQVEISIDGAINGPTTNLSACDSVLFNGTWYLSDTILIDTVRGTGSSSGSTCPSLFFSEVIEGASNNKAVEIYNGTGSPVDLTPYRIEVFFNGNTTPSSTIDLMGIVNNNDVFVLADDDADAPILTVADQITTEFLWNGDDDIVLYNGTDTIDIFGNIGCDPGSEWASLGNGTRDNVLVRKPSYTSGVTNNPGGATCDFPSLNGANWFSLDDNAIFDSLGSHNAACSGSATSGCDTLLFTVIDVLSPSFSNEMVSSCDSAFVVGQWITSNQTVFDTLPGQANSGCDSIVQFDVRILTASNGDTSIAACDSTLLNGNWFAQDTIFTDTLSGAASNGCDSILRYEITIIETPDFSLSLDTTLLVGDDLLLEAPAANTIEWSTGSTQNTITFQADAPGLFPIQAIGYNSLIPYCADTAVYNITVNVMVSELEIPSAFSPNNDGLNDNFRVLNADDYETIDLTVYNRWGEVVFADGGNNPTWNGTKNGNTQPIGAFLYHIEATLKGSGEILTRTGSVSLIR